jgi:hypothetical protein
MTDIDHLLAEVLDGDPDASTTARVAALVRRDPQLCERFLAQAAIAGALRARHATPGQRDRLRERTLASLVDAESLARTGRSVLDRLPPRPAARARRGLWVVVGASTAAAAAVLVLVLLPAEVVAARITSAAGDARLERHSAEIATVPGQALRNGDRITSGSGPAIIAFADGTTATATPGSVVVVERVALGKRLRLETGELQAQVARQPEGQPLLALSERSTITVLGTRFHFATGMGSDFVAVQAGAVEVERRDGARTRLDVGRALVVANDQPLTPIAISTTPEAGGQTAAPWRGTGTGLRGNYYGDHAFRRLVETRIDPQIRFDWPGEPLAGMPADHFTVRWRGRLQPTSSGVHTFIIRSDDGVRLWLDSTLLIDTWHRPDIADQQGEIALEAGRMYDVRIDYFDNTQGGEITWWWQPPGQPRALVPTTQLYPE